MTTETTQQSERAVLPAVLQGHWATPEGAEKASKYAVMERRDLAMGDRTDFVLANEQYLQLRDSWMLGQYQEAAKDRIRWLSVKLAIAEAAVNERPDLLAKIKRLEEALIAALPYIESAEEDEHYKPGAVAKVTKQLRAALTE